MAMRGKPHNSLVTATEERRGKRQKASPGHVIERDGPKERVLRSLSAGINYDKAMSSRRFNRRLVWRLTQA